MEEVSAKKQGSFAYLAFIIWGDIILVEGYEMTDMFMREEGILIEFQSFQV